MESKFVPVTREAHKDTKIRTDIGYPHAHNMHMCAVTAWEMDSVVANYPVVFVKDPASDEFRAAALFGFAKGENLFASSVNGRQVWNATYAPHIIQRHPFSFGVFDDNQNAEGSMPVCIDESSPLVSKDTGVPILDEEGNPSPYLLNMQNVMEQFFNGERETTASIKQLEKAGVLVELTLIFTHQSGKNHTIKGFYAADRNQLKNISEEDVVALNKTGALMLAYVASTSLAQLTRMVQLKNMRITDPIVNVDVQYPDQKEQSVSKE